MNENYSSRRSETLSHETEIINFANKFVIHPNFSIERNTYQ